MWPFNKKKKKKSEPPIAVGDWVTSNGKYENLNEYFKDGPKIVKRIENGPDYAGGKFVYVRMGLREQGFYINGLKKV